jgi:hypothetical protein
MRQVTSFMPQRSRGFALILALSLMAFILLLLLSITTLVQVEVTGSATNVAINKARENAKLGMMVALGELQSLTGPDQRVTARASIFGPTSDGADRGVEILSPEWLGVWDTAEPNWQSMDVADRLDAARWLVSGNKGKAISDADYLKPTVDMSALSSELVTMLNDTSVTPADTVEVMKEEVSGSDGGYYAYWVTDENLKARVDLLDPFAASTDHSEQTQSMLQTQRSGIELLEDLEDYPVNSPSVFKLIDLPMAVDQSQPDTSTVTAAVVEDRYFNSLTTVSQGLLVDVKNGGLKRDLTQAFEYRKIFDENFVVDPDADSEDEPLYFLDDPVLTANGIDGVDTSGPNWHILRSYYRQYIQGKHSLSYASVYSGESADGEQVSLSKLVDLEDYTDTYTDGPDYFEPYKDFTDTYDSSASKQYLSKYLGWKHYKPDYMHSPVVSTGLPYQTDPSDDGYEGSILHVISPMSDNYQLQSWVSPVVVRMQFSFGLNHGDDGLELIVTPVFGVYNPYNTELYIDRMSVCWSLNPIIKITVHDYDADGDGVSDGSSSVEFGLREAMQTSGAGLMDFYLKDRYDTYNKLLIQPGETRYFGIDDSEYSDRSYTDGRGVAMFWQDGGVVEQSNETLNLYNYTPGGGGMVIPLKLRALFDTASDAGVTPVVWHQDGVYGTQIPTKQNSWGLTAAEAAILESLAPAVGVGPEFDFELTLTEDFGLSVNIGDNDINLMASTGKLFSDASITDAITVSQTFSSLAVAGMQDNLLSVGFWLKTTKESQSPWRNLIDSNIRAINGNSEWDGFDDSNGYRVMSTYTTQDPQGSRGVLTGGAADVQLADSARGNGYWGDSIEADGQTSVILFERPRTPLLSLGSLQHANLGRYNFDPTYMIGNSFANVRIPMDETDSSAHSAWIYSADDTVSPAYKKFKIFDTSYLVNEKLWDRYFFSGLTKDMDSNTIADFLSGDSSFANNRYTYTNVAGELSDDDFDARATGDDTLFHQIAASLLVEGAFNVNSTSVDAWQAILGGLELETLPTYTYGSGYSSEGGGLIVSRFTWPYNGTVNLDDGTGDTNFWKGVRELSVDEIADLATAIVDQVKLRGPFLSMADFVNRSLTTDETGKMGALQAALDDSSLGVNTNSKLSSYGDSGPTSITGSGFQDVFTTTNSQAAGFPGYVLQADLLQRLAPVMTVRGDTFLIRSYGAHTDQVTGKTIAEAWCEAVVQRTVLPVGADITAEPEELLDPSSPLGRAYKIVSFRWLDESEL